MMGLSRGTSVRWQRGAKPIAEFLPGDRVLTYKGLKPVRRVVRQDYEGMIFYMHRGEWVTPNHLFMKSAGVWQTAEQFLKNAVPYKGPMWSLEVDTEDVEAQNFQLGNGRIAYGSSSGGN